jgi:hypothetical protein
LESTSRAVCGVSAALSKCAALKTRIKRAIANFGVEFIVVPSDSAERYNAESRNAMEGNARVAFGDAMKKFGVLS